MSLDDYAPNYIQELEELRSTLAWSDAVMAGIDEVVVVVDQAWDIMYANPAFADLIGQARIYLLGKRLWDELELKKDGVTAESFLVEKQLTLKNCTELNDKYLVQKPDQELTVIVHFTYIPKVNQAVIVLRDVTESVVLDEMKSEFINIVSHQLRTPLAGIMLYVHLLADGYAGELTKPQKKLVKTIIRSTDRTVELVGTFLSIARIESGRVSINPQDIDMRNLLGQAAAESKTKALERKIKLVNQTKAGLPLVTTDALLIKEVILNLLSNAIKYSLPKGSVTIDAKATDKELIVSVTDSGLGIPKLEQKQIFSRFFRATNVMKHDTEGSGLGLYLVELIIQALNGRIWFESEQDQGTTFWFSLPLREVKPTAKRKAAHNKVISKKGK